MSNTELTSFKEHDMMTASGLIINLEKPDPDQIIIQDISRHLAKLNRWTGATSVPYSIASHCIHCVELYNFMTDNSELEYCPRLATKILMHDASEAYLGDVSRPLKSMLPDYRAIEDRMCCAIMDAFPQVYGPNDKFIVDHTIKQVDLGMLYLESLWLMKRPVLDEDFPAKLVHFVHAYNLEINYPRHFTDSAERFESYFHRLTSDIRTQEAMENDE